jgi:hypothetical protein
MTAQTFNINDRTVQNAARVAGSKTSTGRLTPHELYIIAADVGDVVRSAGGWLFDRGMAGWKVTLLVAQQCDIRPLQILGIATLPFEPKFESMMQGPQTDALAVAADMFTSDARVRGHVVRALDAGGTEVTLWGDTWPAELGRRLDNVQHRLSAAARAFKAHALVAASASPDCVDLTERFLGCARWSPRGDPDLIPTG